MYTDSICKASLLFIGSFELLQQDQINNMIAIGKLLL